MSTSTYIARCPDCQQIVFAASGESHDTLKNLTDITHLGYIVEQAEIDTLKEIFGHSEDCKRRDA